MKSVNFHPTESWVLVSLYSGNVHIWDYKQGKILKSFEVCAVPVRCGKFIPRKQYIIVGSDDMCLRVYNYNTMEKVQGWNAHVDYVRYIDVHPTLPFVLSSSDDMVIKLWDWEKDWECVQMFEGYHAHYVMMVKFNPKDTNTFASASLDRTIRVWGLGSPTPHFLLEGHEKGVNCIDYYPGGDKPYLMSGSDDMTVKVWDYHAKSCVVTIDGHLGNVSCVLFHHMFPLLITASEDGTVRLWHSSTYRAESTLNYGMERAWFIDESPASNKLAIGYDEGTLVLSLGSEVPVASLDTPTSRIVWAVNNEIQTASLRGIEAADGEELPIVRKDLGNTELFPQKLKHNCNGRFLVVCGDGEYVIYTSQALRNKSFGSGHEFVWSGIGTGDYAVRETISRVKIFKNFKEQHTLRPPLSSAEGMFGGMCLGVKGPDSMVFFHWDEGVMIRKIDVVPSNVFWNESGQLLAITCEYTYYIISYDSALVSAAVSAGQIDSEEGIPDAFSLLHEMPGTVLGGQWVGDCFLYTNDQQRLMYYVGGEVMTLCHMEQPLFLLGYLPKENRVYLMDKSRRLISYTVLESYLQYQTAVVRKDFDTANKILPSIPESEYNNVAKFLESQGFKEEAFEVYHDPGLRFELACELGWLDIAKGILEETPEADVDTLDTQSKWKRLSDQALSLANLELFSEAATRARDLPGLLLLYSSTGDAAGMEKLAETAKTAGRTNIAFLALFLCGKLDDCVQLLKDCGRISEAALFARTYLPSTVPGLMDEWRDEIRKISDNVAESLADPAAYPDLFPGMNLALRVEENWRQSSMTKRPASDWSKAFDELSLDLIEQIKNSPNENGSPVQYGGGLLGMCNGGNGTSQNEPLMNLTESQRGENSSMNLSESVIGSSMNINSPKALNNVDFLSSGNNEAEQRASTDECTLSQDLANLDIQREEQAAAQREQEAIEAAQMEQEASEAAQREQEVIEAAQREQEAREAAQREQEAREAAQRKQEAREAAQREQEVREAAQREQEARETAQREQEAREAAQREQEARKAAQREQEAIEAAQREQEVREAAQREQEARAAAQAALLREKEAKMEEIRAAAVTDAKAKAEAAKQKAIAAAQARVEASRRTANEELQSNQPANITAAAPAEPQEEEKPDEATFDDFEDDFGDEW